MPDTPQTLDDRMRRLQARISYQRRQDFVDRSPRILGFQVKPVTLYTSNALAASLNAFSLVNAQATMRDVAEFLWLHSAAYNPASPRAKARFYRKCQGRAFPFGYKARDWLRKRSKLAARILGPSTLERVLAVIAQIRAEVDNASRDFPKSGDADSKPLPYAYQAYVLTLMRREAGIPFAEAEHMPLGRLVQFLRATVDHVSRGKANLMTDDEAALLADHLKEKTEQSSTPEAMAAAQAEIKAIAARRMAELNTP